jgi:hypothetical protein
MMQYNNQSIVGICGPDDDRAEAWPGRSACGGAVALFWPSNKRQKNKQTKIWRDFRWPAFNDATHNNQPKTRGHNGAGSIEEVQPGGSAQGG